MNLKRIFLYTLIGSVALSALIGIGVILFGNFGDFEVRVLMTTLTVTVTSILGLACGAYIETGRGRTMPFLGIVLSIVSAIMLFFVIWDVLDDSDNFIKAVVTASMLAAACSHLSLLSIARLDKRFAWSRIAAFICVGLLCAILLFILWIEPESTNDVVSRIIGVLSILIAAATVITPVFHKLSRAEGATEIDAIDIELGQLRARINEMEQRKVELTGASPGD